MKEYNILYTSGVFDLLHIGHLRFLEKAKSMCNVLIVGIITDELAESYKRKPIIPYSQRCHLIRALKCVDIVWSEDKQFTMPYFFAVDKFVIGSDWESCLVNENLNKLRDENKVIFIPYTWNISTTDIKKRIKDE